MGLWVGRGGVKRREGWAVNAWYGLWESGRGWDG